MKTLLLVNDDPDLAREFQPRLHALRHEWRILYAGSGQEALDLLTTTRADVLVADDCMPKMNGCELLNRVRELYPGIIRVMLSARTDPETSAATAHLCHYLLRKPLASGPLLQLLARFRNLDTMLTDEHLKQLLHGLTSLPTLPEAYQRLTAALDDSDSDLKSIVALIHDDAPLTLQILKIVNSSMIGLVRHITSLEEAVQYLGLNTLRSLVLAHHIFASFTPREIREFRLEDLWQHSFRTAQIAEALVEEHQDNYLAAHASFGGLLHDIGKLILTHCLPDISREINLLKEASQLSSKQAELLVLGTSHAEVGAYLAALWGLPQPVVEAISLHHLDTVVDFQGISEITVAVWHANRISQGDLTQSREAAETLRRDPRFAGLPQLQEKNTATESSSNRLSAS